MGRRVKRTRKAILIAFVKLINKKCIEKITIKELCELADIHKSTFYLHYRDIYDCDKYITDEITKRFIAPLRVHDFNNDFNDLGDIVKSVFNSFEEDEIYSIYKMSNHFKKTFVNIRESIIDLVLEEYADDTDILCKYVTVFKVSAILGVIEYSDFLLIDDEIVSELSNLLKKM